MENRKKSLELFRQNHNYIMDKVRNGIDENRKSYCALKLTDSFGEPIADAKVTAVLKKHEFKFGAIFNTQHKDDAYQDSFSALFNTANIPLDWAALAPDKDRFDFTKINSCLAYCEKKDLEPRFRALVSQGMFPTWLYGKSSDEVKSELSKALQIIANEYSSKARTIEAIRGMFDYDDNIQFYNDNDYVEWCLAEMEKYMPCNQIVINELSHVWYHGLGKNTDRYYMLLNLLRRKNARIDAIGMEFRMLLSAKEQFEDSSRVHMFVGWWPQEIEEYRKMYDPIHLYKMLDRYSDFGLPINLTGVMIPAYTTAIEDEEIQAELLKYLYSIWFSQKNVEQIMYGDIVDGFEEDGLKKTDKYFGGLLRSDLTQKPAYDVLNSLINKEWKTEEIFTTDEFGVGSFKGFYGEYTLKIEVDGKTYTKNFANRKEYPRSLCPVFGDRYIEITV